MNGPRTHVERAGGVTTVRVILTNDRSTPQTVRLRSELDGPVWPPQRNGVVDAHWTDGVWEATIQPGRNRGVGFASPAPPVDPPVSVVATERHDADAPDRSPDAVLADLDDWRPTSEVLDNEP
ncbi:hypothetical protein [Natranaeroarchaeum aerophilus]|uniref:Uncharacterized protein n=1 Tax=Natranaeroarchaeum aerophilus TaxID=2917711 RepID=A0AAE3K6K4_9EURY|nr:hypothetical protein [Natranaeroarchaeum aerophilus]MCL9812894.1 hypothetical protein [Natranaeroarchaeum aerophilus]